MSTFRVSDIRQFLYCPRIIYYNYVAPVPRISTYKMQSGFHRHAHTEILERRRTLRRYGVDTGTRYFKHSLYSERLDLSGTLDLLIETKWGLFPVEFKDTVSRSLSSHRYQLVAYALLVEEGFKATVKRGFLYYLQSEFIQEVFLTPEVRDYTKKICSRMRKMVVEQRFPTERVKPSKCRDCEFRNYCKDV
ncbi:MAG: CRISPR-associated protein Cas4 [Bacillota bacterium]